MPKLKKKPMPQQRFTQLQEDKKIASEENYSITEDEEIASRVSLIKKIESSNFLLFVISCGILYLSFLKYLFSLHEFIKLGILQNCYILGLTPPFIFLGYQFYQYMRTKIELAFDAYLNVQEINQKIENIANRTEITRNILLPLFILLGTYLFKTPSLAKAFYATAIPSVLFYLGFHAKERIHTHKNNLHLENVLNSLAASLNTVLNDRFRPGVKKYEKRYLLEVIYRNREIIISGERSNPDKKNLPVEFVMGVISDHLRSKMSNCNILFHEKNIHILGRINTKIIDPVVSELEEILDKISSKNNLYKKISEKLKAEFSKITYKQNQIILTIKGGNDRLLEKLKPYIELEKSGESTRINLVRDFNEKAILEILNAESKQKNKLANPDQKVSSPTLEEETINPNNIEYSVEPYYGSATPINLHSNKRWFPNLFSWVSSASKKEVAEPVVLNFQDEKNEYHYDSRVKPINQNITTVRAIEQTKTHVNQPDYFVVVTKKCGNIKDPLTRLFNEEKINLVTRNHGVNGLVVKPQLEFNGKEVLAKLKHDCDDRLIATKGICIKRSGKPDAILFLMDNVVDHKQLKALSKNATKDEVVNDEQFTPPLAKSAF